MTPSRTVRLADHYLRAVGIAGLAVPLQGGDIALVDPVSMIVPADHTVLCCARPRLARHILDIARPKLAGDADRIAAMLSMVASEEGVSLTPHDTVAARAIEAVQTINRQIDAMRKRGELRGMNREFKAARARGEVATYADFMHAKKELMLEALAGVVGR